MNLLTHLLPILGLTLLCAGWVGVQLLARRLGTKNHFDDAGGCGSCSCGGSTCERNVRDSA